MRSVGPVSARPARGLVLIRRPRTESTYAGGQIALLPQTIDHWTGGQAEVIALGPPDPPDDENEPDALDPLLCPGAWVLTRQRAWVEGAVVGTYLVRQSDVVGVFL